LEVVPPFDALEAPPPDAFPAEPIAPFLAALRSDAFEAVFVAPFAPPMGRLAPLLAAPFAAPALREVVAEEPNLASPIVERLLLPAVRDFEVVIFDVVDLPVAGFAPPLALRDPVVGFAVEAFEPDFAALAVPALRAPVFDAAFFGAAGFAAARFAAGFAAALAAGFAAGFAVARFAAGLAADVAVERFAAGFAVERLAAGLAAARDAAGFAAALVRAPLLAPVVPAAFLFVAVSDFAAVPAAALDALVVVAMMLSRNVKQSPSERPGRGVSEALSH
jgi:hypothetical protein